MTLWAELRTRPETEEHSLESEQRFQTLAESHTLNGQFVLRSPQKRPHLVFARIPPQPSSRRQIYCGCPPYTSWYTDMARKPTYFSQKLDIFNSEERICSVLVWYKSAPKKGHRGSSARVKVVVSQSRRQSAVLFELHGKREVTGLPSRFIPDGMHFGNWVGELPVLEILRFCFDALRGRISFRT